MLPIRHKSIFRSRWIALLWAGGIVWSAVEFAGGRSAAPAPAASDANQSAADSAAASAAANQAQADAAAVQTAMKALN